MADGKGQDASRRRFLQGLAGAALAPAALARIPAAVSADGPRDTRPNVLIVFPDQWRRQAVGCYGDSVIRTPHIDRLAGEGVRFTRCYTPSPLCGPARASLLTGRYPFQLGIEQNSVRLPFSCTTFAERLRDAGYSTGYVGKWHLDGPAQPGYVHPGLPRQGFDWLEGFNSGHFYTESRYYTK